ncbi:MAG TPA: hypothetical protein DGT23_18755 [Micromonosporaceae bacterium]|nr:hypothetical protein [Micromonosporaceae bacterium]
MTTLDLNLDQVAARAVALKPMRVLLWVLAAPFILIGLVLRIVWLAPAFLIGSTLEGWQAADKLVKHLQAQARDTASRGG